MSGSGKLHLHSVAQVLMGGLKTPLYQNTKYALLSTPGGGDAASGITLMGRKAVTSHGASDAAPQQLPTPLE